METEEKQHRYKRKTPDKYGKKGLSDATKNNIYRFCIIFALICVVLTIVFFFRSYFSFSTLEKYFFADSLKNINLENFDVPFSPKRQNLLLMGVDPNASKDPFKGARSDTIILVSVAPLGRSVSAISIPRDSKVYFANGKGVDKINHTFATGGVKLTVKTVEETLGIKINHYLVISNKGVRDIIDLIGGLPIYVEKDMVYRDSTSNLNINLSKGNHVLDGKDVEGYLRFRKDALGDIGRVQRQQWFLKAVGAKIKDPQILVKIPSVLKILPQYVQTNMNPYEMSQFIALAKATDMNEIEFATLPGAPSRKGHISYWILDADKTQELVDRLIWRKGEETAAQVNKVGILYTPNEAEHAKTLQVTLENMGFSVNLHERKKLTHDQIAIHNSEVSNDFIKKLKEDVPEIKNYQTVYDAMGFNKANKDFTIVLAD